MSWLVAFRLSDRVGRRKVLEKTPGKDRRLPTSSELAQHVPKCDPLRLISGINPTDAAIQARFNNRALLLFRRWWIIPKLSDERMAAEGQSNIRYRTRLSQLWRCLECGNATAHFQLFTHTMSNSERLTGTPTDKEVGSHTQSQIMAARLTGAVLAGYCCTNFYAALNCRGLYADASHYLLKIAEKEYFHLYDPPRRTLQVLRQAAVVFLRRETNLDLFELGQVFSLSMLLLPSLLCGLCWLILPPERKSWIIFPLVGLLAGVSASSFAAIGEGALAASFLWPLFFLFLFRVEHPVFQIIFLLLCLPVFFLHEASFIFMFVFLAACTAKFSAAGTRAKRIFVTLCAILFLSIIIYEICWIIHPFNAVNRDGYISSMRRLAFIDVDGRWNLPLLTGALALVLLVATTVVRLASAKRTASVPIRVATLIFIVWALFAAAIPWAGDATFSPYPQLVARNQALFVGSILAAAAVITFGKKIPARMWLEPATLVVIAALACAQFSWDVAATQRWRAYMTDVRDRLAASDGLISWEQAFGSGDAGKNEIWRAMGFGWTMPSLSLVLQSGSPVHSLIAAPEGTRWQPFDPANLHDLPRIRGVDYTPYLQAMSERKP